jgi:aspartyl-tRNA(Asn)/glutamyl-tRNA(Gln) amidotransferase subunit C
MAVTKDDVRHIAVLARIGVPEERLDALVGELNGILGHMDALEKVATEHVGGALDAHAGMPLRADAGPSVALDHSRESFAPAMRAGFFLVPRLATHEDSGEES